MLVADFCLCFPIMLLKWSFAVGFSYNVEPRESHREGPISATTMLMSIQSVGLTLACIISLSQQKCGFHNSAFDLLCICRLVSKIKMWTWRKIHQRQKKERCSQKTHQNPEKKDRKEQNTR